MGMLVNQITWQAGALGISPQVMQRPLWKDEGEGKVPLLVPLHLSLLFDNANLQHPITKIFKNKEKGEKACTWLNPSS